MLNAEVTSAGDVVVEGQTVGRLQGFRFAHDSEANAEAAKVASQAIAEAIAREGDARAARLAEAVDSSLVLAQDGAIRWLGDPVAKLAPGDKLLQPRAVILADDAVTNGAKEIAQRRIDLWLAAYVRRLIGPLLDLEAGEGLEGAARGIAFQVAEALGVLERGRVAQEVKGLDQTARGALRKLGVRFGAYYLYLPALLKPAPRVLALQLWTLKHGQAVGDDRLAELPAFAAAGRTSFVADKGLSRDVLRVAGYRLCGERAVRVDILERLADLIRPAVAYRPGITPGAPPPGAADGDGFVVTVSMTSLTGCSGEALGSILRSMGFESRKIKGPAITVPLVEAMPTQPVAPPTEASAAETSTETQPSTESEPTSEPQASAEAAPVNEQDAVAEGAATKQPVEAEAQIQLAEHSAADETLLSAAETLTAPAAEIELPSEDEVAATEEHAEVSSRASSDQPAAAAVEPPEPEEAPSETEIASESATAGLHSAEETEGGAETVTAEQPAPEAQSATSEAPASEAQVAPAEEPLIEVWRPTHHRRGERGQGRGRDRGFAAQGRGHAPSPEEASKPRHHRRGRGGDRGESRPHPHLQARPVENTPAPENPPAAVAAQAPVAPQEARPPRGPRPGPMRRDARPPQQQQQRPRREPTIDPNSPFAKLLALKAELEAKQRGE
jgi:ATP-dependent RNA helicase SUPV3L1/SUV3